VEDGDLRWVFADGDLTTVEVTEGPARARRRGTADAPPTLHAPMPATVVRIVAPPGTRVHRGATVVLLEAMKMELPLRAPHDAVVTAVHCREGELVQPNAVLVDLERLPDAAATEADAAAGTAVRGPGRAVPSGSRQP
jgi:3-methylcrotonyl-CoA carboxylase alpha subunit